jgi:Xaa-Pro dipeptidase
MTPSPVNASLRTPDIGTGALEHRDRIDFRELRSLRTARLFARMDELNVDACIFGREANARYATGVRRLWTSMTRGFVPTCVVLRETRDVHLLSFSASYEGIPEEMSPDHYFPVTWNPMGMVDRLAKLPGASGIRRLGVDGMTPLFAGLLGAAFPDAAIVGVEPKLRDMRRQKLALEVDCMRVAVAVAESALVAAIQQVRPGASRKALQGAYLERMSVLGTSQFAQQGTFGPIGPQGRLHWATANDAIPDQAPIALAGGALWAGYEGSLARTWWSGRTPDASSRSAHAQWADTTSNVIDAIRPGATGADVLTAFGAAPGDRSARSVYSVGLGHEGTVAAHWLDAATLDTEVIVAGMVLAVRELVPTDAGGFLGEEMVLVTDDGVEQLTTLGHGPLSD